MEPLLQQPPLPTIHKRDQSHDSGTYIDYCSEDSASSPDEFVTVVNVESESKVDPTPFVTVLEIGAASCTEMIEEVLLYRLPGERLGFGLKFEGGTNTAERVEKLFIQSSAPDSPASRAKCGWGSLVEGDEILEIDGTPVRQMTRLDCVRCLKESNLVIKLLVRHTVHKEPKPPEEHAPLVISEVKKQPPPPPIPPRKVPRRQPPVPPKQEEEALQRVAHKPLIRVNSNPRTRMALPPEPEVYLDQLALEDEIRSNWSESDDTGSTISTVVGLPTSNSSFSDLPGDTDSLVLRAEEEESGVQPPVCFQDAPLSYGTEEVGLESFLPTLKDLSEECLEEVKLSPKTAKKSSLIPRLAKTIGLLSEKAKPNKKRPAPPPPVLQDESKSFSYLKKKKTSEGKIEKKVKSSGKIQVEKEEAIAPMFLTEEDENKEEVNSNEETKLCWPVPELLATSENFLNDVASSVDEDFGVEAVKLGDGAVPFYLSSWGSTKHLETIGEDEEEEGNEDEVDSGCSSETHNPVKEDYAEVIKEDANNTIDTKKGSSDTDVENASMPEDSKHDVHDTSSVSAEPSSPCTETATSKDNVKSTMDYTILPPYNRMPPDGHEFPQKYQEEDTFKRPPPLPVSEPPKRFGRLGSGWRQDEKSEKSVRDKIAMFSSAADSQNSSKLYKYKSSEDVFGDSDDRALRTRAFSRSVYSVDKLSDRKNSTGDLDFNGRTQSHMDLTSSSSAYSSSCSPDSSLSSTTSSCLGYSSTLPRKSPIISENRQNGVGRNNSFSSHMRSQSLLEITPPEKQLDSLVEQRKKTFSKLRGLVIPERASENSKPSVVDLPEIKSKELPVLSTPAKPMLEKERGKLNGDCYNGQKTSANLTSPPWKISTSNAAIPKYSPAFKRKSISIYGSGSTNTAPSKPPRSNSLSSPSYKFCDPIKSEPDMRLSSASKRLDFYSKQAEDSDNDSAVSSSRSSISPPASPLLGSQNHIDMEKAPDTTNCDSLNRRILKAQSIEAINRKNVLTSAKYSRGFDVKSGSPQIQKTIDEKKDDLIYYKLAENFNGSSESLPVKIAFLNHVEYEKPVEKLKLEKTESMPIRVEAAPHPVPRRVSAPLTYDWSGHTPLIRNPSSESVRSRASSVDTIVERPPQLEAELVPSRIRNIPLPEESVDAGPKIVEDLKKRGSLDVEEVNDDRRNMRARNRRSVSVNDIRKAFERVEITQTTKPIEKMNGNHARVSSFDSTTSDDSSVALDFNQQREQFGSITSLASSTSLISPQELQSLIDEANLTLDETSSNGAPAATSHDVLVVILHRDSIGGSVGITLAGGADYEAKEITVHKVLAGSPADRDGRIQKGDRILSINGKSMKGATHRESLAILKSPRPEVVLVISRLKSEANNQESSTSASEESLTSSLRFSLNGGTSRPPRIIEGSLLNDSLAIIEDDVPRGPPQVLDLFKDGAGLGFSLEGGKDSPLGDKPLVVKKIFTGGAAEKSGMLRAGDEILNVNGVDVSQMSRIEAWKLMKRIPDGNVSITIRRLLETNKKS